MIPRWRVRRHEILQIKRDFSRQTDTKPTAFPRQSCFGFSWSSDTLSHLSLFFSLTLHHSVSLSPSLSHSFVHSSCLSFSLHFLGESSLSPPLFLYLSVSFSSCSFFLSISFSHLSLDVTLHLSSSSSFSSSSLLSFSLSPSLFYLCLSLSLLSLSYSNSSLFSVSLFLSSSWPVHKRQMTPAQSDFSFAQGLCLFNCFFLPFLHIVVEFLFLRKCLLCVK